MPPVTVGYERWTQLGGDSSRLATIVLHGDPGERCRQGERQRFDAARSRKAHLVYRRGARGRERRRGRTTSGSRVASVGSHSSRAAAKGPRPTRNNRARTAHAGAWGGITRSQGSVVFQPLHAAPHSASYDPRARIVRTVRPHSTPSIPEPSGSPRREHGWR